MTNTYALKDLQSASNHLISGKINGALRSSDNLNCIPLQILWIQIPVGVVDDIADVGHGLGGRSGTIAHQKWPSQPNEYAENVVADRYVDASQRLKTYDNNLII